MESSKKEETRNTEVTQRAGGSEQATHNTETQGSNVTWDDENNPYKKRYTDSSREAVKLNQQLRELSPFIPVLNAMKKIVDLLIMFVIIFEMVESQIKA